MYLPQKIINVFINAKKWLPPNKLYLVVYLCVFCKYETKSNKLVVLQCRCQCHFFINVVRTISDSQTSLVTMHLQLSKVIITYLLKVMVNHFKISKLWESTVIGQRAWDIKFDLPGIGLESVSNLQSNSFHNNIN